MTIKTPLAQAITPISIALRARARQAVIWSASTFFVVSYFVSEFFRSHGAGERSASSRELVDLFVLLSWSTTALGFRPAMYGGPLAASSRLRSSNPATAVMATAVTVGVALADGLTVVVGAALIAAIGGVFSRDVGEFGILLGAAASVGVAASLQFEIVRAIGKRAAVLAITALATLAALLAAHSRFPPLLAFVGWLVFPLSGLASATEEPLRLDLAARALSAGVTYDLALIAILLALPGHRARGQT